MDPVTAYASKVTKGRIPACRLIIAACQRHLDNLNQSKRRAYPFRFDIKEAAKPIAFCQFVRHYKGEFRGKVFAPEPWQVFIIGCIFGWKRKTDGLRRFRYAYTEVPRKNGKTFLAAVLALYMLVADSEGGAEVYSAATKKDQARLVWNDVWAIVKASPELRSRITQKYFRIEYDEKDSKMEALGSDSDTLDGLNPHCCVKDELHAWPHRALWDVLEDAYGARAQPLDFSITTAGYDQYGICYEVRTHCINVLTNDTYNDEEQFAFIATADDGDDWRSPATWAKANPNLGVSKSLDYMRQQVERAQLMPSKENAVKNKQLDIWTAVEERWLDLDRWDECPGEIDITKLSGQRCFGGLDLASVNDVAALVLVFPPGPYPEWTLLCNFYLPEDNLAKRVRQTKVPLDQWSKKGFLTLTPGEIIDFDFIFEDITRMSEEFEIVDIGFDPWRGYELATRLTNVGFVMTEMRQGHATLSPPTMEFEKKVMARNLRHGGNPLLRWMAGNATTRRDVNDNIVPDKSKSSEKIDGIVASVMGLGRAMFGDDGPSVYETRGIIGG